MPSLPAPVGRHRRAVLGGVVSLVVVLTVFVLVWFQPHKLWIDERVTEPVPTGFRAPAEQPAAGAGPVTLARGELESREHSTSGTVLVLQRSGGGRVLRFEDLDTSNGPDLRVYLTANPAHGPEQAFDDVYVELGRLKGNQGDQNYDVPEGVDLTRYGAVVIWCDRFDAAFGAADLQLV